MHFLNPERTGNLIINIGSQMEDSHDTIGLLQTIERAHTGDFVVYDIEFKLEMV